MSGAENISMIRFVAVAVVLFSLASCMKGYSDSTLDPNPYFPVERDTIRAGEQIWGITVGETAEEVYSTLQDIRTERQLAYLGIVGNVFTDLATIEHKIPLYNSLFMDETTGTSTGVQLGFEDGKIKVIFLNNGSQLAKWPGITEYQNGLSVGDTITSIYEKLVDIKNLSVYANKLQRLSLFDKNLLKDFDPGTASATQWQVVTKATNKRWVLLELNFTAGSLSSIYYTLNENR